MTRRYGPIRNNVYLAIRYNSTNRKQRTLWLDVRFYDLFFSSEPIEIIVMDAPLSFARIHVLGNPGFQTGFWIIPTPQDGRRNLPLRSHPRNQEFLDGGRHWLSTDSLDGGPNWSARMDRRRERGAGAVDSSSR